MSDSEHAKTVHMLLCPFCKGYHRVHIKHSSIGGELAIEDMAAPLAMLFAPGPTRCPKTGKTFDATEDDWLHLTEEEFYRRYPGMHSN